MKAERVFRITLGLLFICFALSQAIVCAIRFEGEPDPRERTPAMVPDTSVGESMCEQNCVITRWYSQYNSLPSPPIAVSYSPLSVLCVRNASTTVSFIDVLVKSTLYSAISYHVNRYAEDVEITDTGVNVYTYSSGSPSSIRDFLKSAGHGLVGCLLIGDIPTAWYEMETQLDPPPEPKQHEEFPTDIFYMDLDGDWTDSDRDGKYDGHAGATGPEIWVGRLKADDMTSPETLLIRNYFDKNHAYRIGNLSLPQRALLYVDDDWQGMADQLSNAISNAYPICTVVNDKATTNRTDYLNRLEQGWNFVHLMCHGWSQGNCFKIPNPSNLSESIFEGTPVKVSDIQRLRPPVFFWNLFVCSGARFTEPDYLAGWCIFTQTYGLVAIGSTKAGSMLNDQDFYYPLSTGKCFGKAFQDWYAKTGETNPYWLYGMSIIGDPTLGTIQPKPKPDLVISDILWTPAKPVEGQNVTFSVCIKNQGTADAANFTTTCYADEIKLGQLSIDSLSVGQNTTRTFDWKAIEGNHTVEAFVDFDHTVDEYSENNNVRREFIEVIGKPDIVISNVTWTPNIPVEDETVTFNVTVMNNGTGDAGYSKTAYFVDGVKLGEWSVPSLLKGQNVTRTFTWKAAKENHTVEVKADFANNVDEKFEDNNDRREAALVMPKPKPDFVVSDISWMPEQLIEGETVTFKVTVMNNGTANARYSKTAYFVDGVKLGEWSIVSLSIGQDITRSFTWKTTKGNHIVKAIADSAFDTSEENETNNEKEETLTGPKPDLTISLLSWNPENPAIGENITFTLTVCNQGKASTGKFKIDLYIDEARLNEWSINNLSAGQNATRNFSWTVSGTLSHTINIVVDENNEIEEEDESNNTEQEIVGNQPPTASFIYENEYDYLDNSVLFAYGTSYFNAIDSVDPEGKPILYTWDFGDGNVTTATTPIALHNYAQTGTYTVILNVTDEQGACGTEKIDVAVVLMGDLDKDGKLTIIDMATVARSIAAKPGDANWNPTADLNNDQIINILDMTLIATRSGE